MSHIISPTERFVQEAASKVFRGFIHDYGLPYNTDLTRSNFCHLLTLGLYNQLDRAEMPAQREFHKSGELWHYVIRHSIDPPSPSDIITDLNPWQFPPKQPRTGLLHGPRSDVMRIIRDAGAPEYYVSLRGISTITRQHDLRSWPTQMAA